MATTKRLLGSLDPHATNPATRALATGRDERTLRSALDPHRFQRLRLSTEALPGEWVACEVVGVLERFETRRGRLCAWVMAGAAGRVPVPLAAVVAFRVVDGFDTRAYVGPTAKPTAGAARTAERRTRA